MSTAYYPLGMRSSMPSSGYNHNSTYDCKQYTSWKGTGVSSNPIGTAPSHIRPLTNNDTGNVFQTGFGLPRPIKHFRKGRVIPSQAITISDPNNPSNLIEVDLINYNMNRIVKSSNGSSLGGGNGGRGLIDEMIDSPGSFSIQQNVINETTGENQLNNNCKSCEGIGIVSSYYPNPSYLTENPETNVENHILCCSEERKAKQRVIYANTNLSKTYFTTTKQYLQNRCKTYDQKAFNFQQPLPIEISQEFIHSGITTSELAQAKPGSALATTNTYVGNCYPNAEIYDATENALVNKLLVILLNNNILTQQEITTYKSNTDAYNFDYLFNYLKSLPAPKSTNAISQFESFINNPYWGVPFGGPSNPNGCKLTIYKPNNPQYAKQGAVSSSTRMLKLNVDTISTNSASMNNYNNTGSQLVSANELDSGVANNYSNILKNKTNTSCQNPSIISHQNKKGCSYASIPNYKFPVSQPSPYR